MSLRKRILALAGKKSYGLIARQLGISRNAVGGVIWRARVPRKTRASSPNGRHNKLGTGYRTGPMAPKCLPRAVFVSTSRLQPDP
jgi:hypothetical protein